MLQRVGVAMVAAGGVLAAAWLGGCANGSAAGVRSRAVRIERAGVVTMRGMPLTLEGNTPAVGAKAPGFTAVANDMSTFTFAPGGGEGGGGEHAKVWIISAVPSLDTPVCSLETRTFNEDAAKLGPDVRVLTVSMDLPFAQKRWCGAEGIKHVMTVSDYRDRAFGKAYGLRIKENGLLARAVFVVNAQGVITYEQIVPELAHQPDFGAVLAAARQAAGS